MLWKNGKRFAALATASGLFLKEKKLEEKNENLNEERTHQNLVIEKYWAKKAIYKYMIKKGIPGLAIGVSINGKMVYTEGIGYADVETGGVCSSKSVMRIASISKPITSTITALLVNEKKLDLDESINNSLGEKFPPKIYETKSVKITSRQLLSHTSGIRHYEKPWLRTEKQKNSKNLFINSETSTTGLTDGNMYIC